MKCSREIIEILEAYDLTGSYRGAAELAGCDHHTVARYVALRETGQSPVERVHRARPIDDYLPKIEELVARSNGKVLYIAVSKRLVLGVGNAPPAGWSRRPSSGCAWASIGCFGPGWLSRGRGCSGIGVRAQRLVGEELSCGVPGWRGRGFGW